MHILHIEESFIPNLGYQTNLLAKYMAMAGHKITILSTDLEKIVDTQKVYLSNDIVKQEIDLYDTYGIEIKRVPVRRIISNRCQWDKSVFKLIRQIEPDIIYLHGNDSLLAIQYFLFYLKNYNIPVVTDSHMLEVASKNRFAKIFRMFYRKFVTSILVKNRIPVIRVVDDPFINKAYNIPYDISPLMSFGSDIELFCPNKKVRKDFRKANDISDSDLVVIYAGKLSKDKEGLFFANAIKEKLNIKNRNVVSVIIGTTVGEYGKQVEEKFSESENIILRFPLQKYTDLSKFFQMADIGLIPSAASLTFYDMQASGLPIIWSDIPVNAKRTQNNNGFLFSVKDSEDMRNKILCFANMDERDLSVMSRNAKEYIIDTYSYKEVTDEYISILENEIMCRKRIGKYK